MSTNIHIRAPCTHSTPDHGHFRADLYMICLTAFVTPHAKINIILYIIYKEYHSENILRGLIFRFGKLIHHANAVFILNVSARNEKSRHNSASTHAYRRVYVAICI